MAAPSLVQNSVPSGKPFVWAFAAIGCLLRILSYFYSQNSGGDAGAHVALAAHWLQHPSPRIVFDVYEPGHFWLIGAMTLAVPNVLAAGRLLSLLLGIASIPIAWKLAKVLYGEVAAIFSLAAFSLYSLHIGYSSTSSAEVSYLFFLLLALLLFFNFLHDELHRASYLLGSGLSLSVSESIRFEAWAFFFAMFVALAFVSLRNGTDQRIAGKLRPLVPFGAAGGAWPVFMMAYSFHRFGKPLYLVALNSQRVHEWLASGHVSLARQLAIPPVSIMLGLSIPAFVAAVYSLVLSFRYRLPAMFSSIVILFALIQTLQIIRGGLEATARYTITLGAMFAILSGYGIEMLCQKVAPSKVALVRVAVVLWLFLNLGVVLALSESHTSIADTISSISPRLRYSRHIASVAQFLREHRNPEDAVVIDDYNVESNIIADAAGLPPLQGRLAYLASIKNETGVLEYVEKEHPRFLVYSASGTLKKWIPLPAGCDGTDEVAGIRFSCEFSNQIYRIYELSYK